MRGRWLHVLTPIELIGAFLFLMGLLAGARGEEGSATVLIIFGLVCMAWA